MLAAVCHLSFVICHLSFVICHWSLVICHWSFVIGHLSLIRVWEIFKFRNTDFFANMVKLKA
ncbi:MAG: hypothetical protein HEQ19_22940 [Gloeotrichia echinulata CP02]